jgi:Ca-activated chloride channel homolog
MKRLLVGILGLVALVYSAPGAGLIIIDEAHWLPGPPHRPIPPPWPRPLPPPPHVFTPLELESVKVKTRITDQVAETFIDQEFHNPNAARLEGIFVFPVPKGAHLDKFTMDIDGRQVEAELLGADKARQIYEDIVRKAKDPALLEYAGRDLFKVRIFPIEPNSRKRITLSYTQLLKADDNLVGYTLPLNTDKFSPKPIKTVSVKVELETKRPLKSIYSPSHSVEVKRHGAARATAGYEASDVQTGEDFALYFAPEKDEIGVNLLTHRTGDDDGYFLLLASPGVETKEKRVIPKDVVFVLDTSGSMAGKKLEQAKKALLFCVENLNDADRFEIVRFSTEVEPLFEKLVDASKSNRSKAEDFIQALKPMGGTAIDEALRKALDMKGPGSGDGRRVSVVIFLTDGRPTIGTTDENEILLNAKKRDEGRTRVFCFGIGTDVNTHLLDKLTENARGFSQYVLPEEDIEVKVSSFFSKIKEPVLANPTVKFTGGIRATKVYPSPLPDLFKGEQVVLTGRFTGKGDCAVVLEGMVEGERRTFTYEVNFSEDGSDHSFIPRLWATRRVGYLLDEIRLHGENSELKDEATELARKYGIVTPYTSYLIVEDEARHGVPTSMRSFQSLDRDREARREAAMTWNGLQENRSGDAAVADAMAGAALKSAEAPIASAAARSRFMQRYGLSSMGGVSSSVTPSTGLPAPAVNAPAQRLLQYSQNAQFVGGKNFFQNEKQWIDPDVQKNQSAKRVRIQFASTEYFDLAAKYPATQKWLALGQNVQFFFNNTIYDIYE